MLATGLIKPEHTDAYSFTVSPKPSEATGILNLHDEHGSIDLYIDGKHVTPDGSEAGIITLTNDRWYAFELRYVVFDNKVADLSEIPAFSITWQSDNTPEQIIMEAGGSLAIDVDSELWSDAILTRQIGYTF